MTFTTSWIPSAHPALEYPLLMFPAMACYVLQRSAFADGLRIMFPFNMYLYASSEMDKSAVVAMYSNTDRLFHSSYMF